jgi:hypothetical protein
MVQLERSQAAWMEETAVQGAVPERGSATFLRGWVVARRADTVSVRGIRVVGEREGLADASTATPRHTAVPASPTVRGVCLRVHAATTAYDLSGIIARGAVAYAAVAYAAVAHAAVADVGVADVGVADVVE